MNVAALDVSGVAIYTLVILALIAWLAFVLTHIIRAARAGDTRKLVDWAVIGLLFGPVGAILLLVIRNSIPTTTEQSSVD
jgi:hypothetical protein